MANLLASAVAGVVFGLALAAPPGPMNAVIAEESVVRGWLSGFFAGLGAMTADACFLVLALFGAVTVVGEAPALRGAMVAVGGLLMLYFAYGAVEDARNATAFTESDGEGGKGFRKALVLALTNPYQIVFWLSAGVYLVKPRPEPLDLLSETPFVGESLQGVLVVETGSPPLLVGFFLGIGLWITGFPAALVGIGKRIDEFAPAVAYASAAVLAGFGVLFLFDAAGTLGTL